MSYDFKIILINVWPFSFGLFIRMELLVFKTLSNNRLRDFRWNSFFRHN